MLLCYILILLIVYLGSNKEGKGIVPRACEEVLTAIQNRYVVNNIESRLAISYIEIFGDEVSDLLRGGRRCGNSTAASHRYVLQGLIY